MRYFVGVTDDSWYEFLAHHQPEEVNFWRPSAKTNFKAIPEGAPFLFKLHSPNNYITGGGFFVRHSILPITLAWDAFGIKNGADTFDSFRSKVMKYNQSGEVNPSIGCIILTEPFFFQKKEWIPAPENWKPNIVQGKTYNTEDSIGQRIWQQVEERIGDLRQREGELEPEEPDVSYGGLSTIRYRVGQGAFRIMVTEVYNRRCAITGEKTLPVLEAGHIKPYSESGPNIPQNGLLLRSDMHILFDQGYMTLSDEYRVEVSSKIREEFENGRNYYAWHGRPMSQLPVKSNEQPDTQYLKWHRERVYKG